MKDVPIVGKFLIILAVFGVGAAAYSTSEIRRINAAYGGLNQRDNAAAHYAARANRALMAGRAAIADVVLSNTAEGDRVALADFSNEVAKAANKAVTTTFATVLIGLLLIVGGAYFALRSWITAPLADMVAVMNRLAGGDLTTAVVGAQRRDEVGTMAKAVQAFKDAGIDKARLEAVTADARTAAEDERVCNEREVMRVRALADGVVSAVVRSPGRGSTFTLRSARSGAGRRPRLRRARRLMCAG